MTTAEVAASALSDTDHRRQLRRAVVASAIGTTIEWYDFFIYGIVISLVFAQLYFPKSDALIGTLQAYAVFFVGFVAVRSVRLFSATMEYRARCPVRLRRNAEREQLAAHATCQAPS